MSACPVAPTPADSHASGQFNAPIQPSESAHSVGIHTNDFRGSITRPTDSLSTLRNGSYLHATQDSLPAGGQPLPGRIPTYRVSNSRFQIRLHRIPPSRLGFARRKYTWILGLGEVFNPPIKAILNP